MTLPLPAQLLRGFAIDFLTAHDPAAARRIMHPRYQLSIGGYLLDGRDDAYLPATVAQLDLFPGLCVTVHDVVLSPDAVAMRFTEHGVSAREGKASGWGGITLFTIGEGTLQRGWAEEDYLARKRQLKSGAVDRIGAPHPAPWDEPVANPDADVEAAMQAWLDQPTTLLNEIEEISAAGPRLAEIIRPRAIEISAMFSAGPRGAFHAQLGGGYAGGFADVDPARIGDTITLSIAGILDTCDGKVTRAQICGDRLGLNRRLIGP